MAGSYNRRAFLKSAAATGAAIGLGTAHQSSFMPREEGKPLFKISLAEWSFHRTHQRWQIGQPRLPGTRQK